MPSLNPEILITGKPTDKSNAVILCMGPPLGDGRC